MLALTHPKTQRIQNVIDFYANQVMRMGPQIDFRFVNAPPTAGLPNIPVPPDIAQWRSQYKGKAPRQSQDIMASFLAGVREMMTATECDWLFRGIDDTLVNVDALPNFLQTVATLPFDPWETPKVYGNCVEDRGKPFLQGGSGMLFSRAAVELIMDKGDSYLLKMPTVDDVYLNTFLNEINETLYEASSPFFSGHTFVHGISFTDAPQCQVIKQKACNDFIVNPRELVFFHQKHAIQLAINNAQTIFSAPPGFGIHNMTGERRICTL